jgi:hypothetical protein
VEDLDDSSNTLVANHDGDSDDGVESRFHDNIDSILPVLDYESDGGSIKIVSDGSAMLTAVFMARPASDSRDPVDPHA